MTCGVYMQLCMCVCVRACVCVRVCAVAVVEFLPYYTCYTSASPCQQHVCCTAPARGASPYIGAQSPLHARVGIGPMGRSTSGQTLAFYLPNSVGRYNTFI